MSWRHTPCIVYSLAKHSFTNSVTYDTALALGTDLLDYGGKSKPYGLEYSSLFSERRHTQLLRVDLRNWTKIPQVVCTMMSRHNGAL